MRHATRALVLAAAVSAWIPGPAKGQPAAPFGEVVDVELVEVDVWVTDSDGMRVPGLRAADFRVEHGGSRVEISHFVDQAAAPQRDGAVADGKVVGSAAAAVDLRVAEASAVIVYFDQTQIHPAHVAAMVDDLGVLLDSAPLEPEQVLVLRQDAGLHVEVPFGSSRRELGKALERLRSLVVAAGAHDSHGMQALDQLQELWRITEQRWDSASTMLSSTPDLPSQAGGGSVLDRLRAGGRDGAGGDACTDFLPQAGALVLDWARFEARKTRQTLESLRRVGGLLAGVAGVKSLVYVGDGLETEPGAPLASFVAGLCPGQGHGRMLADLASESMDRELLELTRDLNARRVSVYAVQAGGLTSSRLEDASRDGFAGSTKTATGRRSYDTRRRSDERQGMELLARHTGGRLVVRRNELAPAMRELAGDLRPHYTLAYTLPDDAPRDAVSARGIEVEVAGEGREVRFRRGWAVVAPDRQLADRLDGALFLGLVENPLGVGLGAAELRVDPEGAVTLPLRVMVPVAGLQPVAGTPDARLQLRVVARHAGSQELTTRESTFRVPLAEAPADGRSTLPVDLVLAPGSYTIAVGLRDEGSRQTSLVTTDLDLVPD